MHDGGCIEYLNVRETARRLQVHENTVRNWAKEGKLQPANIPGSRGLRFDPRDVERLTQRRGQVVDSIKEERRTIGPELVDATQLHAWAELRPAQDKFPELVRRLLHATPAVTKVSVRAAEGVALSGWDGRAESDGNALLPKGSLIIELGVGNQPKRKADSDFEARKTELGAKAKHYTFVFATPRRWRNGASWAEARRAEGVFGDVAVLDADDLEAWLQLCPDVHVWISQELGRRPRDAQTLTRWWERFRQQTDPSLPLELFGAGRQAERAKLIALLRDAPTMVTVQAGWRDDALAFVELVASAVRESQEGGEALTVASAEVWDRVIRRSGHMMLIPLFDSPDIATALERGHHVVLVVGRDEQVRGQKIELIRPDRHAASEALRAAGVEFDKAYRLAGLARRSMPALVRALARDQRFATPPWVELPWASILAPAMLAGAWSMSEADRSLIERLVGQEWSEIERVLNHWHESHDAPFVKSGQSNWRLASPEEAFLVLSPRLATKDVDTWRSLAPEVLLEIDPTLDLSAEERPMAGLLDVRRRYSAVLREGVAQGLALLGSLDQEPIANAVAAADHASIVVRELLGRAAKDETGRTWQSLSDVLPLIAEASPSVFLDAVHADLDRPRPLLASVFQDKEGDSWFSSSSPHTGLLWALECLAWAPEWMLEASLALARLDVVDLGGRLGNRPLESLCSILPHWIRHTSAPLETRVKALQLISKRAPDTGWSLLLRIWPRSHATSSPPHSPRFRDWKPESRDVPIAEQIEYIGAVVTLAVELAGDIPDRWADLAEHVATLPPGDRERILIFLEQKTQVVLDDPDRLALWNRVHTEIARHRRFSSAEWSMEEETLERLDEVARRLEPKDQVARYAYLFDWHPDLPADDDDYASYEAELGRLRVDAVRETLEATSLDGVKDLASRAKAVRFLGTSLAEVEDEALEPELIAWLDAEDANLREVAFAWAARTAEIRGLDWVIEVLGGPDASTDVRRTSLIRAARPTEALWDGIEAFDDCLLDAYWEEMNPWGVLPEDMERAARELVARGRAWSAIDMLTMGLHRKDDADHVTPELVLDVLEGATRSDPRKSGSQVPGHELGVLLDFLASSGVDSSVLAPFEFLFFRLLDDHRQPRALFEELSNSPKTFVDLVRRVYRGKNDPPKEPTKDEASLAEHAWWVLHGWHQLPGITGDGGIDAEHLTAWVRDARLAFAESDRADIGDEEIGRVLSASPPGTDGIWPAEAVRELVETIGNSHIESGFVTGRYNSRGTTMRGAFDGGDLERDEAARYLEWSRRTAGEWPRTSRMLRGLAQSYTRDAQRMDAEAEIRGDAD